MVALASKEYWAYYAIFIERGSSVGVPARTSFRATNDIEAKEMAGGKVKEETLEEFNENFSSIGITGVDISLTRLFQGTREITLR